MVHSTRTIFQETVDATSLMSYTRDMRTAEKPAVGSRVRVVESNGSISAKAFVVTAHSGPTPDHTVLSDEGFKFSVFTSSLIPHLATL